MINKISLDLTKNIPTRQALIFGMENENNSSYLEIKLPYSLVDKWLYIEFSMSGCEPFTTPRLTAQDIDGNAILVYEIGNSITQYLGFGKMQVVAKNASGLVWKSSEVDYIIKNSINATEQIVENKPDVIADLQRQIDEISEGGGSTPSGSNSSGIYVVTQDLALEGTSSTPLDSVLVGEKELQIGDILTDNNGTIAKVSSIEESSGSTRLTAFQQDDIVTTINFDTSMGAEKVNAILESLDYSSGICNLLAQKDGDNEIGILVVANMDGAYMIAVNNNGNIEMVYNSTIGWIGVSTYDIPKMIANVVNATDGWNGVFIGKDYEYVEGGLVANYEVVSNQEIPQEVWEGINEARAIAEGRNKAVTFYDLTAMVVELPTYGNTILKIGDNLYIKQTNVPDYWVSEVYDTFVEYTYISDEQTILDINNGIQIGYYGLAVLETNKVEVSNNYTDLENKPTINGVELSGNKTGADLGLGTLSSYGGFSAGTGASAKGYGGAVGYKAFSTDGGAIGGNATAYNGGGAVGQGAKSDRGGAIGYGAETYYGGAIGIYTKAYDGFAGGFYANSRFAPDGTTKVEGAVAIGYNAKAQANEACQLGKGTNANEGTLQFRDYQLLGADGKIPTERLPEGIGGDENAFMSLASGQPIEKIVFNPNVSVEKMTNYLSGLTYDREISGIPSICNLVDLMGWYGEANASNGATFLHVYAIDFSALNAIVPNTSGYGIAVCETLNENLVLKQAVFATEYNEANVTLINAIKDPNYVLNYTKAGWGDTNDYNVSTYIGTTNGDYTIQSITVFNVYDNKVSAFIGRDSRFFEVVEMLDNDTELKEFTATLVTNTKANITKLAKIIHTAKGAIRIEASGAVVNLMGGYFNNSQGDSSIVVSRISSGGEYGISIVTTEAYSYNNNAYTRTNTVQIRTDKTVPTVTNSKAAVTIQITYYNDVEITA